MEIVEVKGNKDSSHFHYERLNANRRLLSSDKFHVSFFTIDSSSRSSQSHKLKVADLQSQILFSFSL